MPVPQVVIRRCLAEGDELWCRDAKAEGNSQGGEGQGYGACTQGMVQEIGGIIV